VPEGVVSLRLRRLTKGQFSATAEMGSKSKGGVMNDMQKIDCCLLGIESTTTKAPPRAIPT